MISPTIRGKKTLGILRNKTQTLILNKQAKRKKTSRFAKDNLSGMSQLSENPPTTLRNPLTLQLQRMPTMSTLPPQWVEKYEQCLSIVNSIDDIKKQILTQQSRRLSLIKVSQQKQSERKIYDLTTTATKVHRIKFREQNNVRNFFSLSKNKSQDKHNRKKEVIDFLLSARNNVCMSLAFTIQQKTKELRNRQRAFIQQRQNIQNSTKVSFLELAAERAYDDDFNETLDDEEQMQLQLKVNAQRNEQILRIIQSVHELNDLYKELNNLVIVQGSLLDRIDYNIQQSVMHVKKADQTLGRVDERQKKSKCSCIVIVIMLLVVVILGIVLIVKWSK